MGSIDAQVIRPGLLVGLRTAVSGGVRYLRYDVTCATDDDGTDLARWTTERQIRDRAEYDAARKTRQKCGTLIRRNCIQAPWGLLCPDTRTESLSNAIADAQKIAALHNQTATHTRVSVTVICGRIAETDQQAIKAITGQLADLCSEMERAIAAADVSAIRDAAKRALGLSGMLEAKPASRATAAVKTARKIATTITKRLEQGGQRAAKAFANIANIESIERARFAFLEISQNTDAALTTPTPDADDDETPRSAPPPRPTPKPVAVPGIELARFVDLEI